jgi:hypothetical protein
MYIALQPLVALIAGILIFNHSKIVELHRCNLSDSGWNPRAGENVARLHSSSGCMSLSQ